MADQIANLGVTVGANTAQFDAGMKRVKKNANSTANSVKASFAGVGKGLAGGLAASLSIGLLSTGIKAALNYAGSLGEVSQQLGVTTKDLQVLRYAAGQVGVSQEELDKGLGKLTITLGQVAAGAVAPTKALAAIGLSAKDLAGVDTGTALRMIADGLAKIPDRAQRAAVEVALFGRTGAKLDTVLSGGSKAINELSLAAEKLGIVLSDRQIQSADETADKLDAVKTVLAAQISGVVADNAGSILSLSQALASLTSSVVKFLGSNPTAALAIIGALAGSRGGLIGAAAGGLVGGVAGGRMAANQQAADLTGKNSSSALLKHNFIQSAAELKRLRAAGKPFGGALARTRSLKQRYDAATGAAPAIPTGADVSQFLAPAGAKPKTGRDTSKDAERERLEKLRDAYRFDEDMRRADMDILRAKTDLSTDYHERSALNIQLLDLEKASYSAELDYQVASGEISKAQASQLQAKYDLADVDRRKLVLAEEEEQRARDYETLEVKNFEIVRETLEKKAGLADTASERRAIELEILRLAYEEKRRYLQNIIDTSKDWAEQESARRELGALGKNEALDRQGVMKSTQGPLEGYLATLPTDAAKMNEALEQVAVGGLQSLEDGLMNIISGTESVGEAFKKMASQIIADLLRIQMQKMIAGIISSVAGGMGGGAGAGAAPYMGAGGDGSIFGFAHGGSFDIQGNRGVDRNIMSLNGLPIARVSHGERVSISNDNQGGGMSFNPTIHINGAVADARKTGMQVAAAMKAELARSSKRGY